MKMVLAVGLKYYRDMNEAEDLVIHVFEVLHKKAFRHDVKNVSSWLYTLAKNECLMDLRKKKREFSTDDFSYHDQAVESEELLHLFKGNDDERQLTALRDCIEQLKEEQQLTVKEFYLEQKSYKEIADEQELDLKKVKSYIQNGKRNLKNCIEARL